MGMGASDPIGIVDEMQQRRVRLQRAARDMSDQERIRRGLAPRIRRGSAANPARPKLPPPAPVVVVQEIADATRTMLKAAAALAAIEQNPAARKRLIGGSTETSAKQRSICRPKIRQIIEAVRAANGLPTGMIEGPRRTRAVSMARRMVCVLALRISDISVANIARIIGIDHTSVLNADKQHKITIAVAKGNGPELSLSTAPTKSRQAAVEYLATFRRAHDAVFPLVGGAS